MHDEFLEWYHREFSPENKEEIVHEKVPLYWKEQKGIYATSVSKETLDVVEKITPVYSCKAGEDYCK